MRRKDLESLREHISYHESHLGQDPSEDNTPGDEACSAMVQRLRWLLPQKPMMLLQRGP